MTLGSNVESTSVLQRVVLLGVTELSGDGVTPAHAGQVRRVCDDATADVDGAVVGRLTEAEVTRALNELEAVGLVTATREDASPSGKGRPKYRLAAVREAILDELADADRISALVERLQEN